MNINMAFPWAKRRRDDGAYWEFCIIFASILQVAPETIFQERAASARRVVFPSTNNEVIPKQVWRKGISRGETEQELRRRRCIAPLRVGLQRWTNAGRGSSSIYACTHIYAAYGLCTFAAPSSIDHNYLHHHFQHYHYRLYPKGLIAF
jgi:hypothetical protein